MIGLLVSVRNAEEAAAALGGGAAIIDVKEPARGALGSADLETIVSVAQLVAGRLPLSVAIGELLDPRITAAGSLPRGVDYVKLGLAGCALDPDWQSKWQAAIAELDIATSCVAVAYADWQRARAPAPRQVLEAARALGCGAVLVDTFDKSSGSLLDVMRPQQLAAFISLARAASLRVVVAGQLKLADVKHLAPLLPDLIGVRGAVCHGGRSGALRQLLVTQFVRALESECSKCRESQARKIAARK